MQARYQYGNLTLRKRAQGPDVWQFRWMENGKPKSVLIGTIKRHPTRANAERALEHLRIKISNQNSQSQFHAVTVGGLIDRFAQQEFTKWPPIPNPVRVSHLLQPLHSAAMGRLVFGES